MAKYIDTKSKIKPCVCRYHPQLHQPPCLPQAYPGYSGGLLCHKQKNKGHVRKKKLPKQKGSKRVPVCVCVCVCETLRDLRQLHLYFDVRSEIWDVVKHEIAATSLRTVVRIKLKINLPNTLPVPAGIFPSMAFPRHLPAGSQWGEIQPFSSSSWEFHVAFTAMLQVGMSQSSWIAHVLKQVHILSNKILHYILLYSSNRWKINVSKCSAACCNPIVT